MHRRRMEKEETSPVVCIDASDLLIVVDRRLPPAAYYRMKTSCRVMRLSFKSSFPDYPMSVKRGDIPAGRPSFRPFHAKFLRFPSYRDRALVPDLFKWLKSKSDVDPLPKDLQSRLEKATREGLVEWIGCQGDLLPEDAGEILEELSRFGYPGLAFTMPLFTLRDLPVPLPPLVCSNGAPKAAYVTWANSAPFPFPFNRLDILIRVKIKKSEDVEALCAQAALELRLSKFRYTAFEWLPCIRRSKKSILFGGIFDGHTFDFQGPMLTLALFGYQEVAAPKRTLSPDRVKPRVSFRFTLLPSSLQHFMHYDRPPHTGADVFHFTPDQIALHSAVSRAAQFASHHTREPPKPSASSTLPVHHIPTLPTPLSDDPFCRWISPEELPSKFTDFVELPKIPST